MVEKRGRVAEEEVKAFLAAGFTKVQVLEVFVAVAFKLISYYTNQVADIPLDEAFQAYRWASSEDARGVAEKMASDVTSLTVTRQL